MKKKTVKRKGPWAKADAKIIAFYDKNYPDKTAKIKEVLAANPNRQKKIVKRLLDQYGEKAAPFFEEEAKLLLEESNI